MLKKRFRFDQRFKSSGESRNKKMKRKKSCFGWKLKQKLGQLKHANQTGEEHELAAHLLAVAKTRPEEKEEEKKRLEVSASGRKSSADLLWLAAVADSRIGSNRISSSRPRAWAVPSRDTSETTTTTLKLELSLSLSLKLCRQQARAQWKLFGRKPDRARPGWSRPIDRSNLMSAQDRRWSSACCSSR